MDNIFQGQVPSRVLVALVKGSGYSGAYHMNPYNFHHYNVNSIGLYVDSQSVPGEPIQCNYEKDLYTAAFLSLFEGAEGNFISRTDYPEGYCMYMFNISEKYGKEYMEFIQRGHTRLNLRFDKTPTETLTVIVYSQFPSVLKIDETRNVML